MFPAVTVSNLRQVHSLALKYPTLDEDNEVRLIEKAQSGCDESTKELIMSYLRIVTSQVLVLNRRESDAPDLFQEGCIALLSAIRKFDLSRGIRLAAFATLHIRSAILDWMREKSDQVKLWTTKPLKKLMYNSNKYDYKCPVDRQRAISELNIDESDLVEYDRRTQFSTVTKSRDDEGNEISCIYETMHYENDENYVTSDKMKLAKSLIDQLTERQQQVMNRLYFGGMSKTEISKELGISDQRVSQIEKEAFVKLQSLTKEM